MNYYNNNNQLLQQLRGQQQLMLPQPNQVPQINESDFFSLTATLDKQSLQKLVAQARSRGISDQDIQAGLEILLQQR